MGRKRLPMQEKKVRVSVSIKQKYVDLLKEKGVNLSKIIEEYAEKVEKE